MKAKIKREGNRLDITIKGNTFTKYMNKCILCGSETIDDVNKGAKHICEDCYKLFENNKTRGTNPVAPTEKIEMGFTDKKKKRTRKSPVSSPIVDKMKAYKTTIKILNLVDYKNLMEAKGVVLNDAIINTLIDLIAKGINTTNKICKALNISSQSHIITVRTYLSRLERFGMIYKNKKKTARECWFDNMFNINRGVVYTLC